MLFHARATSFQLVVSCSLCKEGKLYNAIITRNKTNQASVLDSNPLRRDELLALVQETGLLRFTRKDEIGAQGDCYRQDTFNKEDVPPLTLGTVQGTLLGIFLGQGNKIKRTVL